MLAKRFNVEETGAKLVYERLHENYNIAPTQTEPTIIGNGKDRAIELMRWGFVAPWMKDLKDTFKYSSFNARSEDIFNKPMWKLAIRQTRCLVPANGFYEWLNTPSGKQPFYIKPRDQEIFSFAGLYGFWKDAEGMEWPNYSIITTHANKEMLDVHHRMPVIVHPGDETRWLDSEIDTPEDLLNIMQPYPDGHLEIIKVSREVNSSRNDGPTLIKPLRSERN